MKGNVWRQQTMSRDKINVFIKFYCTLHVNDKTILNDNETIALLFINYIISLVHLHFEHGVSACGRNER